MLHGADIHEATGWRGHEGKPAQGSTLPSNQQMESEERVPKKEKKTKKEKKKKRRKKKEKRKGKQGDGRGGK